MPKGIYLRDRTGSGNSNWRGGKFAHPLYDIYHDMIGRCSRPSHPRYSRYGGRGISICQSWLDDFWNFVHDMGYRPERFVLDRIDNDGNYEPSNCRWTDTVTSANNRDMSTMLSNRLRDTQTGRFS